MVPVRWLRGYRQLSHKSVHLSPIPGTNMLEGKNQLPQKYHLTSTGTLWHNSQLYQMVIPESICIQHYLDWVHFIYVCLAYMYVYIYNIYIYTNIYNNKNQIWKKVGGGCMRGWKEEREGRNDILTISKKLYKKTNKQKIINWSQYS